MKNLSKKLSYTLYILLVAFLMVGCTPEGSGNDMNIEENYKTVIIEGCEYIYVSRRPWSSEMIMTHKGNCPNH